MRTIIWTEAKTVQNKLNRTFFNQTPDSFKNCPHNRTKYGTKNNE